MHIPDFERRRRLVARHHLGRTAEDGLGMTEDLAAVHSSDPATPYLAAWARIPAFETAHLEQLLTSSRDLWRMHAMRRTLFLVPAGAGPAFEAGAARAIARKERTRLEGWLEAEPVSNDVGMWLERMADRILEVLSGGAELTTAEIAEAVPEVSRKVSAGSGKWATTVPVSSRLLYLMAMEGRIVRTSPAGTWRSSQYRWAAVDEWWPRVSLDTSEADGRVEITRRYLEGHGPATMSDIRWWTGWTVRDTRPALDELEIVEVELDSGEAGFVLASDTEDTRESEPGVAFLPGLDPTPMGWKERDWYLGPHTDHLFDRNGNVGPSIWVDGRIVGGWGQTPDGAVVYEILESVTGEIEEWIAAQADDLGGWLDGVVVTPRFRTPLEKRLSSA